jgi:hypothetical protein
MSSSKARKFVADADGAARAWKVAAALEERSSKAELRELLRRERLRSSHLQRTIMELQVERDFKDRTVTMLRSRLQALEGSLQSKRTYSNIDRMLQHRRAGKRLKELDPKWRKRRKLSWVKAKRK